MDDFSFLHHFSSRFFHLFSKHTEEYIACSNTQVEHFNCKDKKHNIVFKHKYIFINFCISSKKSESVCKIGDLRLMYT